MTKKLLHGGYALEVPEGIHQHQYAGGGYPGCGGFIEALEIECVHGPIFLIQEYVDDEVRRREKTHWRWRAPYKDLPAMLEDWERVWCGARKTDGWTVWHAKPFWETVDYNNPLPPRVRDVLNLELFLFGGVGPANT
jgi:hypothetical protein